MGVLSFSCPQCGAPIKNLKNGHAYHCPYCNSDFSFEQMQENAKMQHEKTIEKTIEQHKREKAAEKNANDIVSYECKQCGSEVISDNKTVATSCLYCHSPHIVPARLIDTYAPDKIIPFAINEEKAKELFYEWVKEVSFLPDGFANTEQIAKMKPLYAPYWFFSKNGEFEIQGTGVRQTTWTASDYRFTKEEFFHVTKEGKLKYDRIPVNASVALDNKTMELLEPYDYSALEDFEMAHLIGHYAEKYDDCKDTLSKELNEELIKDVEKQISELGKSFYSFDEASRKTEIKDAKTEYVFIPIWILNYRYEDTDYTFTMNGQTGKVVGMLPVDKKKQMKYFIIITIILYVIILIIAIWAETA